MEEIFEVILLLGTVFFMALALLLVMFQMAMKLTKPNSADKQTSTHNNEATHDSINATTSTASTNTVSTRTPTTTPLYRRSRWKFFITARFLIRLLRARRFWSHRLRGGNNSRALTAIIMKYAPLFSNLKRVDGELRHKSLWKKIA